MKNFIQILSFLFFFLVSTYACAITYNDYGEAYVYDYNKGTTVRAPQYDRDTGNRRYDNKPARKNTYQNYYNPNIPGMIKPIPNQIIIKQGTR